MKKLENCRVRGIPNNWFVSYLSNEKKFVSLNNNNLNLANVKRGLLQGFIQESFLFHIYINDLHPANRYSKAHHSADETIFLNFNNCKTSINKQVDYDLEA